MSERSYHGATSRSLEREIAQSVHPMKDRSDDPLHHERMLLPRSYVSLLYIYRSGLYVREWKLWSSLIINNLKNLVFPDGDLTSHIDALNMSEREMFYLTTHSTHFIYGYMASDIWLRTILIVRKETRCHHIGYSYRLTARVLLYAPSHRQDSTYHSLCYTSRGALAGTRNNSMGPPHEGSIRRPIAP